MKKVAIVSILFLFINTGKSFSVEKPCSEHNKITHYKLYKKCMDEVDGNEKNKSNSKLLNLNINKKYKDLRKKIAPKTGEEIWKDFKNKKQ